MSEAGYSECSLQSEHVLNYRQLLTKTEALSAKQQVTNFTLHSYYSLHSYITLLPTLNFSTFLHLNCHIWKKKLLSLPTISVFTKPNPFWGQNHFLKSCFYFCKLKWVRRKHATPKAFSIYNSLDTNQCCYSISLNLKFPSRQHEVQQLIVIFFKFKYHKSWIMLYNLWVP